MIYAIHIMIVSSTLAATDDIRGGWGIAVADLYGKSGQARLAAARKVNELASSVGADRGRPGTDPKLIETLNILKSIIEDKKENSEVRVELIKSLGSLGPLARHLSPALISLLNDESESDNIRSYSVVVLPSIGPIERVAPAILGALKGSNTVVKVNALQNLKVDQYDRNILIQILNKCIEDENTSVNLPAILRIGDLAETSKDNRLVIILLGAMHKNDLSTQRHAVLSLQESGHVSEAKSELLKLLAGADQTLRIHAEITMITIFNSHKYIDVIVNSLNSDDPGVREEAVMSLSACGPEAKAAVPALERILHDGNDRLQILSATDLIQITGNLEKYLPALTEKIGSKKTEDRNLAVNTIELMIFTYGTEKIRPHLIRSLTHKDPAVRASAVDFIEYLGVDKRVALSFYSGALDDKDAEVRLSALQGLGKMGPAAKPILTKVRTFLQDKDGRVRTKCNDILENIKNNDN